MLVAAIILSVLILTAFLRIGIIAEYTDAGFDFWLKIGFIKLRLSGREHISRFKRVKKQREKRPGDLNSFLDTLKAVRNTLRRLKRRLLINKLVLYYSSAGDDAAKTAIGFGAANAVFGAIVPILERHFRIKHRDLRVSADFEAEKPSIYAKIAISLAVWEGFYILFALFPVFSASAAGKSGSRNEKSNIKDRKDGESNGKSTDK